MHFTPALHTLRCLALVLALAAGPGCLLAQVDAQPVPVDTTGAAAPGLAPEDSGAAAPSQPAPADSDVTPLGPGITVRMLGVYTPDFVLTRDQIDNLPYEDFGQIVANAGRAHVVDLGAPGQRRAGRYLSGGAMMLSIDGVLLPLTPELSQSLYWISTEVVDRVEFYAPGSPNAYGLGAAGGMLVIRTIQSDAPEPFSRVVYRTGGATLTDIDVTHQRRLGVNTWVAAGGEIQKSSEDLRGRVLDGQRLRASLQHKAGPRWDLEYDMLKNSHDHQTRDGGSVYLLPVAADGGYKYHMWHHALRAERNGFFGENDGIRLSLGLGDGYLERREDSGGIARKDHFKVWRSEADWAWTRGGRVLRLGGSHTLVNTESHFYGSAKDQQTSIGLDAGRPIGQRLRLDGSVGLTRWRDRWLLSGRLRASAQISKSDRIFASMSRHWAQPSLDHRRLNLSTLVPNHALEAEEFISFESGIGHKGRLSAAISGFAGAQKARIIPVFLPDSGAYEFHNADNDAAIYGGRVRLELGLGAGLRLHGHATYRTSDSDVAPYSIPRLSVLTQARYQWSFFDQYLKAALNLIVRFYAPDVNAAPAWQYPSESTLPASLLYLDLRIVFHIRKVLISITGENLLDNRDSMFYGIRDRGRIVRWDTTWDLLD